MAAAVVGDAAAAPPSPVSPSIPRTTSDTRLKRRSSPCLIGVAGGTASGVRVALAERRRRRL